MEQVAVMQNIFYNRKITRVFDLKGSLRGRFTTNAQSAKEGEPPEVPKPGLPLSRHSSGGQSSENSIVDEVEESQKRAGTASQPGSTVLLDGDFLELTMGRPMPLTDRAKAVFQMSILNVRLDE